VGVTTVGKSTAIVTWCDIHPARPARVRATLEITCTRCKDAIAVNLMNPDWAAAGYFPVHSWDGGDAFSRAVVR